jgi:hypothetical protein
MKTMLVAAAATSLALALASPFAMAEGPRASSSTAVAQSAEPQSPTEEAVPSHYEWQYHYVGRHARLEGYWALVR